MQQPRRRLRRTLRWLLMLSIVLLSAALVTARVIGFPGNANETAELPPTVEVELGNLTVSVSGSGTVAAEQLLDLPFEVSGRVEKVLVDEGVEVQTGQTLAALETRELELAVADAEANLVSVQTQLEQAQEGNATEQDLISAQANIDQARAQLNQQINGNSTASDIASAEANIQSAQAQLDQQTISLQADIAAAESRLREAQATLDDLLDGAERDEHSTVQRNHTQALAQYNNAITNLEETRNRLSREKTQVEQDLHQATIDVQTAQSDYSVAYWRYQGVTEFDKVPATTDQEAINSENLTDYGELTEEEAFHQAALTLEQAEVALDSAQVAYDNARQAEITGVQQAQQDVTNARAALDDAQVQLEVVQAGATDTEIAQARETVTQAQIELDRLRDESATTITQSEANLAQAQAQLQQVQEGGTEAEIAAAQASLTQAQAQYHMLIDAATETDLRIQQTTVLQAENDLERAQINLENAELTAPFDGVITVVNVGPGSVVSENDAAVTLINRDPLHVDLTLNENDITQIAVGQAVTLSISALPDWEADGTVTYIAPVAEDETDVVTYLVRISFPDTDERVRVGMTADLDIITASAEMVLLVPSTALLSRDDRQMVLVLEPGATRPRPVPVETGLTDGTSTEITAGLEAGAEIVAQPVPPGRGQESDTTSPGILLPGGGGPPGGGPPGGGPGGGRGGGPR